MLGIILIPLPLPSPSSLEPHPSNSSVLQRVQSGRRRCGGGRLEGLACLSLVQVQNDDETIWMLVVGALERGLHGCINDFLAVQ